MYRRLKWWIFRKVYCWVNLYEVERAWGGPEEGGWWYDYGEPVKSVFVLRGSMDRRVTRELEDRAKILKDDRFSRFSAAGGTDYEVYHEPHPGRTFPKEVPHYE